VLQYAENRALRETMYRAYATRASELGPQYGGGKAEWDNTAIVADELKLRREEAQMLGYRNFAEVSLAPKMAESPQQVIAFLEDLATRARPHAEKDWDELRAFAAKELGLPSSRRGTSPSRPKAAPAALRVLGERGQAVLPGTAGAEGPVHRHRNAVRRTIKPDDAPVWHKDVRFFRVENRDGSLVAQFYLDLYAREGKRGGAWMDDARAREARRHRADAGRLPDLQLLGAGRRQAGVLHARRSDHAVPRVRPRAAPHADAVDELGVSGINGVEWDASSCRRSSWRTSAGNGTCCRR
jgi:oligopeptidase A